MTTRSHAPLGSPCWADLWSSDVPGCGPFYGELFGWEMQEPSPEFGGYFMFHRDGVPVAGGMGEMGEMPANDTWKIYLNTDDMAATVAAAGAHGAEITVPSMPVADLGIQTVLVDPTGAQLGAWQPGTFPGFTVLEEHGSPSWFELHTRDQPAALDFYRTVFRWKTNVIGDSDEFRYSTMANPEGEGELAGIMDSSSFLPEDSSPHWAIYWEVDDVDASTATVQALGGAVVAEPQDSPYGRIATVSDHAGAVFRLRTGPK